MNKGFTLLEILITTLIFAVLSGITYSVISNTLKSETIQKKHSKNITELQNTFNFINRDMTQIFNKEFELSPNVFSFTSLQNEQLLNLEYAVVEKELIRRDITNEEEIVELVLIKNIEDANIQLLDLNNKWYKKWDKKKAKNLKAIEIKFEHPVWGKIIKWVSIQ